MASESNPRGIGTLTEGAAALVAVGFVVSVIYDWGFVRALGLDFAQLPTTTADHFRSGVLWFPSLLLAVFVFSALEFQFQRVERGLTEKEIVESSSNPERMRKFREGPWKLLVWTAPVYAISFLLIGDALASVLPLTLSIVWMGFAEWCYSAPLIKLRRSQNIQVGFTFLPIIGILAFFSGYNAAIDAAARKPTAVTIERPQPLTPLRGNLLRTLDKGVLMLSDKGSVEFTPWNEVQTIVNKRSYEPFRGVLCEWFGRCISVDSTSNKPVQPTAGGGG